MERIVEKITFPNQQIIKRKRVAAYARVSSGKDAMLHSLSAQISYYSEMIQSNPEWLFVSVYADEAITGTKESRPEFSRLIEDCMQDKIDMIITKSISRFARNTLTVLNTVRTLKLMNIDVYFEEQNIHSISPDGELMLSILASYAQEESLSVSENMKWRIRKGYEEGRVNSMRMLGYKRNSDGRLEIVPDEAEIVRFIFDEYICGKGLLRIAKELNEKGIKTINNAEWDKDKVRTVLHNEKYAGNLLLQKKYVLDHLSKKCVKNKGELPQYWVEGAHEPIINIGRFKAVEKLLTERAKKFTPSKDTTAVYPFSGLIECGCCGKHYNRKTTVTGIVWVCSTYNTKGKKFCPTSKQIPEGTLISVCNDVLKTSEFDVEIFSESIQKIIVPSPNVLTFVFRDGKKVNAEWKDRSRSESWTEEMKQKAREKSRRKK